MPKRKLTYKDFKRYFSNNLQNKEKQAFEKQMMQDAFEEEAYDGLSTLTEKELEQDIAELKSGINIKTNRNKRLIPVWYRYAASIIILIGIGTTLFVLNNRFWQGTMLKEHISKAMEIANSNIPDAEMMVQETTENNKDTSANISKEFIADNQNTKIAKPIVVDENKKAKVPEQPDFGAEEPIELSAELEIAEYNIVDERVLGENIVITESLVEKENIVSTLQGKAKGVEIEDVPASSVPETNKHLRKSLRLANQDKKVTFGRHIKGKIVSTDDNLSIPGVSIMLEDNPAIGTTTNIDGEFSLIIPESDADLKNLIASFIGMESQTISIEGDTNLLVMMESSQMALDEVVVVAYGSQRGEYSEPPQPVKTSAKPPYSLNKSKYKQYILENIDYSILVKYPGKHKLKLTFLVDTYGNLSNFNFEQSPGIVFNKEIERVMKEVGSWIPATTDGTNRISTVKLSLKIDVN